MRTFDDRSVFLDRFGWLLLATGTSVVGLALIDVEPGKSSRVAGATFATLLVGASLLLALRASGLAQGWQHVADAVVVLTVGVNVIVLVLQATTDLDLTDASSGRPATLVVLSALSPVVVIRRLVRHRRVTARTLLGAMSAYLLIPIAFFYAFITVNALQTTDFFGQPEPTMSFMYFSLTSVTTLGYGDLAAATNLGRLVATAEAVLGQIYLVTFVAMLVGLFIQQRTSPDLEVATRGAEDAG